MSAVATRTVSYPASGRPRGMSRFLRELGFLLPSMPIAIVGFTVLVTLFSLGVGTAIIYIGVPLLLMTLLAARWLGRLELARLRWAGQGQLLEYRIKSQGAPGFFLLLKRVLGGGRYWLALVHGTLINPILSLTSWTITVVWLSVGLGGVSYWVWSGFLPNSDRNWQLSEVLADWVQPGFAASIDPHLTDNLIYLTAGVLCLVTLPAVVRGLVTLHALAARGTVATARPIAEGHAK